MKSQINLKVTNNTGLNLPISILGTIQNQNSLNNVTTAYEFDMSGETFSSFTFIFGYYSTSAPATLIQYQFFDVTPTIQGYVDALNTLNLGLFTFSGNIIYMFSSNYIGGLIKL